MEGSETKKRIKADRRRASILAMVLSLQALASVFFIADVGQDLQRGGLDLHSGFEGVVALVLIVGTAFGSLQMRQILSRIHQAETAMSVASGAFFDLIEVRFAEWGLTPSEAEVALFTLKGLDIADIAAARGAAQGTVRAQLAKVYAKARVSSRGQLTSTFIEDLLMSPNERSSTGPAEP